MRCGAVRWALVLHRRFRLLLVCTDILVNSTHEQTSTMKLLSSLIIAAAAAKSSAFVVAPCASVRTSASTSSLQMGLFDFFSEEARKEREERKQREIEEQERLQREIIERRKASDYQGMPWCCWRIYSVFAFCSFQFRSYLKFLSHLFPSPTPQ